MDAWIGFYVIDRRIATQQLPMAMMMGGLRLKERRSLKSMTSDSNESAQEDTYDMYIHTECTPGS